MNFDTNDESWQRLPKFIWVLNPKGTAVEVKKEDVPSLLNKGFQVIESELQKYQANIPKILNKGGRVYLEVIQI